MNTTKEDRSRWKTSFLLCLYAQERREHEEGEKRVYFLSQNRGFSPTKERKKKTEKKKLVDTGNQNITKLVEKRLLLFPCFYSSCRKEVQKTKPRKRLISDKSTVDFPYE